MKDNQLTSIILDRETHEWVRAYAFNNHMSMATIIRRAIEAFKQKIEKDLNE